MPQHNESPAYAALAAATLMQHLDPGSLADLRRMDKERIAPAFWRLVVRYPDTIGCPKQEDTWVNIVRILAILTSNGDPGKRKALHDRERRLGEVLCDGGDPDWAGPKPVFSETRLMRLLAARGPQRVTMLTGAARTIARSKSPGSGLNVPDIAYALLSPGNERHLAEPYYRRLDGAAAEYSEEGIFH